MTKVRRGERTVLLLLKKKNIYILMLIFWIEENNLGSRTDEGTSHIFWVDDEDNKNQDILSQMDVDGNDEGENYLPRHLSQFESPQLFQILMIKIE